MVPESINAFFVAHQDALWVCTVLVDLGTTQALIDGGANPRMVDQRGKMALDYALEGGHGGTAGVIRVALGDENLDPVFARPLTESCCGSRIGISMVRGKSVSTG